MAEEGSRRSLNRPLHLNFRYPVVASAFRVGEAEVRIGRVALVLGRETLSAFRRYDWLARWAVASARLELRRNRTSLEPS